MKGKSILSILILSLILSLLLIPAVEAIGRCKRDTECKSWERCVGASWYKRGTCLSTGKIVGEGGRCSETEDCSEGLICQQGICKAPFGVNVFRGVGASFGAVGRGLLWIGSQMMPQEISARWILMYLVVIVMLAFAFKDIFLFIPIFGNTTNWVLAIGLAILVGLMGGINTLVVWFYSLIGAFGAFAVGIVMLAIFVGFLLGHVFIIKFIRKWVLRMKLNREEAEAQAEAEEAASASNRGVEYIAARISAAKTWAKIMKKAGKKP